MQVGLFAKKVGMTQVFDESGTIFPVTILKEARERWHAALLTSLNYRWHR